MAKLIDSMASIKHLNIRKEGPDDEKVLAIDIKFGFCDLSTEMLARILGAESESDVAAAFWDHEGNLRFSGLEPISSWAEIKGALVTVNKLQLPLGTAKKFKAALHGERSAKAEFSLTVKEPSPRITTLLADLVQDDVSIVLETPQEELEFAA